MSASDRKLRSLPRRNYRDMSKGSVKSPKLIEEISEGTMDEGKGENTITAAEPPWEPLSMFYLGIPHILRRKNRMLTL